jgi:predicted nucleotidyltransferase
MLKEGEKAKLQEVADRHQLDLIVLFGSYAKGKTRPDDLDIAVRITRKAFKQLFTADNEARWQWEMHLLADLETLIELPYDIDLVLLNQVFDSTFLFEVARYGILIYGKEPTTFDQFRAYASRRFDDDAKFRRWGWEYLKRRCLDGKQSV